MLSFSNAKLLKRLKDEGILNASAMRDRTLREALEGEDIIRTQVKGTRQKLLLRYPEDIDLFVKNRFGIDVLEDFIALKSMEHNTGAEALAHGLNTKGGKNDPQTGLYFSSMDGVVLNVNGTKLEVNTPNFTALFVHRSAQVTLDEDVLIVGVENFENLRDSEDYRRLFETNKKILFVFRTHLFPWITTLNNRYIHFGDIDLAGISIYLNEIVPKIPHDRHRFFIPENIEVLIKTGDAKLFQAQEERYRALKTDDPSLQSLIELLRTHRKAVEQQKLSIRIALDER